MIKQTRDELLKEKKSKTIKLIETIIENIYEFQYATTKDAYGSVTSIIKNLDTLEDYLIDHKDYEKDFKEDIRYIRYLLWGTAYVRLDSRNSRIKDAIMYTGNLMEKLKYE